MDHVGTFEAHRSLLFGIAYRMLGTVTEAQDLVQDAWLRWDRAVATGEIVEAPRAYLSRTITRLAIDRLREEKARREEYLGPWLPAPLLSREAGPEEAAELAESLRAAFLVLLERLSPVERAVFLLREVFGYGYDEIARIVEKSEANCRQILARARRHVDEGRKRFEVDREEEERIAEAFFAAFGEGDAAALESLLARDAVAWSDGGGKVAAARKPVEGAAAVARLFAGIARLAPAGIRVERTRINGLPGMVAWEGGEPRVAMSLEIAGGRVVAVRSVLNPDKLAHLRRR